MNFHTLFDFIKSSLRSYDVLLEIFLVVSGCRTAILVNIESAGAINYIIENDMYVVPFWTGKNNYLIWNTKGPYHKRNFDILIELQNIVKKASEPLYKNKDFNIYVGKMLNYMTPIGMDESNIGKATSIRVSFKQDGINVPSIYHFTTAKNNAAKAPITWTEVTPNTYHAELYPQFVYDKSDKEIEEYYKSCIETLQDKTQNVLLPFSIQSVALKIQPFKQGVGRVGGSRRRRRRLNRRSTQRHR